MAALLDTNAYGRPVLTVRRARELAGIGSAGSWYTAPFATHWTVGLISAEDQRQYHVLDEHGEPLRFDYEWDAWEYLRRDLKIQSWQLPPSPQRPVGISAALFPNLSRVLNDRRAQSKRLENRRK